jgi:hypothetical protein
MAGKRMGFLPPRFLLGATLVLLLTSVAYARQPTSCGAPREACTFFDAYVAAFNRHDWEAFRATFDDSITVLFDRPVSAERRDDREAVGGRLRHFFPAPGRDRSQLPPPIHPEQLRVQDLGTV